MDAVRGQHGLMFVLVLGMLLSLVLAVAVVGVVAIPARREGRDLLTSKGEKVVSLVRDKTGSTVETARGKTGGAVGAVRDKVADLTSPNED